MRIAPPPTPLRTRLRTLRGTAVLAAHAMLAATLPAGVATLAAAPAAHAQMAAAPQPTTNATGLLASDQLEKLLPATVFFSGQSAPTQLRNSAAYRTAAGRMTWAALVDTSGYSTGVREKYQFYFVTEVPVAAGTLTIRPGAYGGGFLADNTFVLLDISGAEIGRTPVEVDSALKRPRPLQMTLDGSRLRLYLGRQFVTLSPR